MCLYCIGKVSNCSIKSCGRSCSAYEGTIYAYTKALLGKIVLTAGILSKNIFAEPKIVNEYDQEITQSQTADNPVAP